MTGRKTEQGYNAGRRIRLLGAGFILACIVATAGWFFVADRISSMAGTLIEDQRLQGNDITCENRDVRGYPFRFGVFCDRLAADLGNGNVRISAGALRSAAQFYQPNRAIIELDAPLRIDAAGQEPMTINWSLGRASVLADRPLPQRASIVLENASLQQGGTEIAKATQSEVHMRQSGGNGLDLAGRVSELVMPALAGTLKGLPPLGADFDLTIDGAAMDPALVAADDNAGTLRRFAILLNEDRGILVSGPWSRKNRLLSGDFTLRIVDADAVFKVLEEALPQQAGLISAFAAGQPRTGEKGDEVELKIAVENGKVRMGFITLGNLPAF